MRLTRTLCASVGINNDDQETDNDNDNGTPYFLDSSH